MPLAKDWRLFTASIPLSMGHGSQCAFVIKIIGSTMLTWFKVRWLQLELSLRRAVESKSSSALKAGIG